MRDFWDIYLKMKYAALATPPRISFPCPSGSEILKEAKQIAREVGMTEQEIEECINEHSNSPQS